MKHPMRVALLLTTVLYAGAALAEDAPAAPDAGAAKMHHHHRKPAAHSGGKHDYGQCVKEKSAVAEYFCSSHADVCQSEKDAVAHQCRQEARGVRQTG